AHRLGERASKAGVGTLGAHDAWERVLEKIGDMKETAVSKDKDLLGQEIGALLFRLADLARLWGLNSEQLLRDANREFLNRI
ncbi:MAG: nucleoside triphosphate pyrophosphohydrolase, partial [Deltaproteobacteria bacterium]|nr:nucleoside triphosphate pyrophosphohydrolase [Deltaproteobacteria bacterium]